LSKAVALAGQEPLLLQAMLLEEDLMPKMGSIMVVAVDLDKDTKNAADDTLTEHRAPHTIVSFKGDMPDMNGHAYQNFNESDNKRQFRKMMEALGRWINMNTKNSGDLMTLYTDLQDPIIKRPEPLSAEDAGEPIKQLLWKETDKDLPQGGKA
jgi:hypothetical protein